MPELPEVETVVQTLKKLILDRTIIKVEVLWENIIDKIEVIDFKEKVKNQKIKDIHRQGKIIIFELDDYFMLSHLRMEGKYYYSKQPKIDKHSHVIFYLDNDMYLIYNDVRKFGKISLVKKELLMTHPYLLKLAKEPFNMSKEELFNSLSKSNKAIKTVLLDQNILAGLGNIYVDEVLFLSKIHPETPAKSITLKQSQDIINNSIITLNKAISLGGTTIRSYTSSLGVTGKFQNELNVHTKKDEPCINCGSKIIKIKVNGRGSYLCPNCQKK
ncbi:DNA-formamidopyrimidine glycosylase [Mycoplasma sp. P36-A1]|uniref:DNA-formamidopyrimidine glycosylase n=1 Tax=Mycoplasma sp. P36-A1 TaxID=3252900 RepID=UPI003C2C4957